MLLGYNVGEFDVNCDDGIADGSRLVVGFVPIKPL